MAEEQNKHTRTVNKLLELIPTWIMVIAIILIAIAVLVLKYKDFSENISKMREDFSTPNTKDSTSISETTPTLSKKPTKLGDNKRSDQYHKISADTTIENIMQGGTTTSPESHEVGIPQVYKIGELKAKLISCSRNEKQVKVGIQISNSYDGNIVICTRDGTWVSEMLDENNKKYFAHTVVSGDEKSQRCLEIKYIKGLPLIFYMIFENVDGSLGKVERLKISTSIGDFVFTKFYVSS